MFVAGRGGAGFGLGGHGVNFVAHPHPAPRPEPDPTHSLDEPRLSPPKFDGGLVWTMGGAGPWAWLGRGKCLFFNEGYFG